MLNIKTFLAGCLSGKANCNFTLRTITIQMDFVNMIRTHKILPFEDSLCTRPQPLLLLLLLLIIIIIIIYIVLFLLTPLSLNRTSLQPRLCPYDIISVGPTKLIFNCTCPAWVAKSILKMFRRVSNRFCTDYNFCTTEIARKIQSQPLANLPYRMSRYITITSTRPCYSTGRIPHTWPPLLREAAHIRTELNKHVVQSIFTCTLMSTCSTQQDKQYDL